MTAVRKALKGIIGPIWPYKAIYLGDPGAAPSTDQPLRGQQSQLQGGQDPHAGSESGLSSATHVRRLNGHDFSKKGHTKKGQKMIILRILCITFAQVFVQLLRFYLRQF